MRTCEIVISIIIARCLDQTRILLKSTIHIHSYNNLQNQFTA